MKIPESKRLLSFNDGIRLVQKGGFAYHTQPDPAYSYIGKNFDNREICELTEVHLARYRLLAMWVSKNCTFVEMLRVG